MFRSIIVAAIFGLTSLTSQAYSFEADFNTTFANGQYFANAVITGSFSDPVSATNAGIPATLTFYENGAIYYTSNLRLELENGRLGYSDFLFRANWSNPVNTPLTLASLRDTFSGPGVWTQYDIGYLPIDDMGNTYMLLFPIMQVNMSLTAFKDTTPVLTPVPEPDTYAMIFAGMGVVGLVARRRSKRASLSIASN